MDRNKLTNILLACIYIPLSLFVFFLFMGTEALFEETNPFIIIWTRIFSYTGFFMFAICIASMLIANILYKKNRMQWSYVVRFTPIYLLVIMILLDTIITAAV